MPRRIEDYALLGDTQTAALVSRTGSIDWLCLPRFDSDACFAALLGTDDHGCWSLRPRGRLLASRRRYRDRTLLLETELESAEGTVRILDFMPPRDQTPDLVRVVEGVKGRVHMDLLFRPRFGYGQMKPWYRPLEDGVLAVAGPDALGLHTPITVREEKGDLRASFTVTPKDRVPFVLAWGPSHLPPPRAVDAFEAVESTTGWWREWLSHCTYQGTWKEAVDRSLVVLKALTYLPTGGIVAAPTTSLPEHAGGVRNWDYRFCWLRDATFTLFALVGAGFEEEAEAWRDWLLRAVAGDPSQLQIMYGPAGERRLPELDLPWLPGFLGSKPVRVGNQAVNQFQLDIYGEVIDALHQARLAGMPVDAEGWRLERLLLDFVGRHWKDRDHGIWEVRGRPRHFTHSRIMAWVALDRAIHAVETCGLEGDLRRWKALRSRIHKEVCHRGFNRRVGAFTQYYGSKALDASLLMIPLVGFLPVEDPRVKGTVEAIGRELSEDGLIRRYRNNRRVEKLEGEEGVFLACSFWYADNLFLLGRKDEARALFERLLSVRNDVGLLSEQYDPRARRMLGNYPQAFSHVSLVNTARLLEGEGRGAILREGQDAGVR